MFVTRNTEEFGNSLCTIGTVIFHPGICLKDKSFAFSKPLEVVLHENNQVGGNNAMGFFVEIGLRSFLIAVSQQG